VDVTWVAGGGCSFTLDLPLTLATATGLLFRVGSVTAAVPAEAVEQVLWLPPQELSTVAGRAVALVEGVPVPVEPLSQALGLSGAAPTPSLGRLTCLLLSAGGRRAALSVDEVLGEEDLVVAALGSRLDGAPAVGGASVLPDGRIIAVLNPAELLHRAQGSRARATGERRLRVLVVDDSLTTRAAVRSMLEIAGYDVTPAGDGEEALTRLREAPCHLVVSDVQMPRLDGIALTRAIRGEPALARTPIILVTSLERPEDRAAGLQAGADGYLVKRQVERGSLLELVRQLAGRA